jgi:protein-ribulosamine 3-kinase
MISSTDSYSAAGDFPLDSNVLAKLTKILSANRFGTLAWTITARLNVEMPDGSQGKYFLKCAAEDAGRTMMEGEFNAMSELYKTMPNFIPKPHSWGKYRVGNPEISEGCLGRSLFKRALSRYRHLSHQISFAKCVA